jgi:hypothetical protein
VDWQQPPLLILLLLLLPPLLLPYPGRAAFLGGFDMQIA